MEKKFKEITNCFINYVFNNKSINISIRELCKVSRTSRTTFYQHFESIEDLISKLNFNFNLSLDELTNKISILNDQYAILNDIFDFFKEHKKYILIANYIISDENYNKYNNVLKQIIISKFSNSKKDNLQIRFLMYGIYGILLEWIRSNCIESKENIIKELLNN